MSVLPRTRTDLIEFVAAHMAPWAADPAAIGLTPEQLTALATALTTSQSSQTNSFRARDESKAATLSYHSVTDALRAETAGLIKHIKAFAATSDDPDAVYALAQISPGKPPAPRPAPETPVVHYVKINPSGTIRIDWSGSLVGGTFFEIQRQMVPFEGQPAAWSVAGVSQDKTFTDSAIPAGFRGVTYRITARRGGLSSESTPAFTVYYGTGGGSAQFTGGDAGLTLAA